MKIPVMGLSLCKGEQAVPQPSAAPWMSGWYSGFDHFDIWIYGYLWIYEQLVEAREDPDGLRF